MRYTYMHTHKKAVRGALRLLEVKKKHSVCTSSCINKIYTICTFTHTCREGSKQVLKEGHCSNSLANERAFIKTRFQNWLVLGLKQNSKLRSSSFCQTMTDACIIIIACVRQMDSIHAVNLFKKGFNFQNHQCKKDCQLFCKKFLKSVLELNKNIFILVLFKSWINQYTLALAQEALKKYFHQSRICSKGYYYDDSTFYTTQATFSRLQRVIKQKRILFFSHVLDCFSHTQPLDHLQEIVLKITT